MRKLLALALLLPVLASAQSGLTNWWSASGTDTNSSSATAWSLGYLPTNSADVLGWNNTYSTNVCTLTITARCWSVMISNYTGTITMAAPLATAPTPMLLVSNTWEQYSGFFSSRVGGNRVIGINANTANSNHWLRLFGGTNTGYYTVQRTGVFDLSSLATIPSNAVGVSSSYPVYFYNAAAGSRSFAFNNQTNYFGFFDLNTIGTATTTMTNSYITVGSMGQAFYADSANSTFTMANSYLNAINEIQHLGSFILTNSILISLTSFNAVLQGNTTNTQTDSTMFTGGNGICRFPVMVCMRSTNVVAYNSAASGITVAGGAFDTLIISNAATTTVPLNNAITANASVWYTTGNRTNQLAGYTLTTGGLKVDGQLKTSNSTIVVTGLMSLTSGAFSPDASTVISRGASISNVPTLYNLSFDTGGTTNTVQTSAAVQRQFVSAGVASNRILASVTGVLNIQSNAQSYVAFTDWTGGSVSNKAVTGYSVWSSNSATGIRDMRRSAMGGL